MLIVYKLLIDTGRMDLQDEPSIGFQNGIYHLSTAYLNNFHACLDRNSFSEISQQNMILKGGELSLVEGVRINVISRLVLLHISRHEIALLGCRVTMSVAIDSVEKMIFERMLISGYPQSDEVSFEISLVDSALAEAEQVNLKIPQGFGGGSQLETSTGAECLLRLYRQDAPGESIGQGIRLARTATTPELEQLYESMPLLTHDDKPMFGRNFIAAKVQNAGSGRPAEVVFTAYDNNYTLSPELSGREGEYIEICAGPGRGNVYRIRDSQKRSDNTILVTLDRPVEIGEILTNAECFFTSLREIPAARRFTHDWQGDLLQRFGEGPIKMALAPRYESEYDNMSISVFRFADTRNKYAIPRLTKDIKPIATALGYRAKVANDDGSYTDTIINLDLTEVDTDSYLICEFHAGADGKTSVALTGKQQPRWKVERLGTAITTLNANLRIASIEIPREGEKVPLDSMDPNWVLPVVMRYERIPYDYGVSIGLCAALYWRIDDAPIDVKYKIRPKFSFEIGFPARISLRAVLVDDVGTSIAVKNYNIVRDDANDYSEDNHLYQKGTRISLSSNSFVAPNEWSLPDTEGLLDRLRNLLVFESNIRAKYVYLQIFLDAGSSTLPGQDDGTFRFAALPIEYEREIDVKDMLLVGYDSRDSHGGNWDVARRAKRLCLDCGIKVNEESFNDVGDKILDTGSQQSRQSPFIPVKHGDKFADKLAEICRAANFSIFSNGSELSAKYFFATESTEQKWVISSDSVIKDSVTVRSAWLDSVATEWNFAASTWNGQKTLSIETSAELPSLEFLPLADAITGNLTHAEYAARRGIPGFGIQFNFLSSEENPAKYLRVGSKYEVQVTGPDRPSGVYELASIRLAKNRSEALFFADAMSDLQPLAGWGNGTYLLVTPLKQERAWREIVSGTLNISYDIAQELLGISKVAASKTNRRLRLDERYSRHQIVAFGNDETWLENFVNVAEYNSFAKNIISFDVPIDCLPEGRLSGIMLVQCTLKFGRFKHAPVEGRVVGYSLSPADDTVRIEVINSQPMRDILWFDENMLENQLIVDETENAGNFYSEQ